MKALLIAGVAATLGLAAHADEDEYAAVHTVAVVSTLGGSLHWEIVGMSRFDTKDETLRLDTSIDDYIERSVTGVLRSRFTVRNAPARAMFTGGTLPPAQRRALAASPEMKGVDAYVVVMPAKLPAYDTAGIVVSHHAGAVGDDATSLRSAFEVDVIDAHTGERIDYGTANSPRDHTQWGLIERCDNAIWSDRQISLSAAQKAKLVGAIEAVIDRTLPFALSNAKLITDDTARGMAAPDASGRPTCYPS